MSFLWGKMFHGDIFGCWTMDIIWATETTCRLTILFVLECTPRITKLLIIGRASSYKASKISKAITKGIMFFNLDDAQQCGFTLHE